MLKYFYVAQNGPVAKSDLYRNLRKHGNTVGAPQMVRDLEEFSRFYAVLRTADKNGIGEYFDYIQCKGVSADDTRIGQIHLAIEGLRLFNVSQAYPLIYAALNCYMKQNIEDRNRSKKLVSLFELLEHYHFVNNAICDRIGNEVEKLYANFCTKYIQSDNFEAVTLELISELKEKLASEKEFCSRFVELTYQASTIPLLAYIFDRMSNKGLDPGQRVPIFNADQRILRKSHNIEHFLPRSSEAKPDEQKGPDFINNIGNLMAISFRTNSKLGDLTPAQKREKLNGPLFREIQNQTQVREFLEKYKKEIANWNEDAISRRAQDLAKDAYKGVWNIS
jgi:Protein of unknown function (DUF1524)